jgi:hypothetical protein
MQPDGNAMQPDGNAMQPDGNAMQPDGNAMQPDGNAMQPDGNETRYLSSNLPPSPSVDRHKQHVPVPPRQNSKGPERAILAHPRPLKASSYCCAV